MPKKKKKSGLSDLQLHDGKTLFYVVTVRSDDE